MYPLIPENSYVLTNKNINFFLKEKKIFIFKHDRFGLLIKRLIRIDESGKLWFESLNENGLKESEIGPIKKNNLISRVIYIFK